MSLLFKYKINFNKIKLKRNALKENPFLRGVVMRARIQTPRKPNSAKRPVAKVILSNNSRITSHIPGIGHNLRRHSSVLIRGGGARDLPGVSFTCIRGKYDLIGVPNRFNRRSRYGIPRPETMIKKLRRKLRV